MLEELTKIVERWRLEAQGHYCQTYNRGKAEGLEAAADELEAFIMVQGFDEAAQHSVQRTADHVCPMCGTPCGDKPMHIMCDPVSR